MFDFLSAVELNECGARLQLLVHVFNVFRAPVVPIIDHRDQKVLPRVLGMPPKRSPVLAARPASHAGCGDRFCELLKVVGVVIPVISEVMRREVTLDISLHCFVF